MEDSRPASSFIPIWIKMRLDWIRSHLSARLILLVFPATILIVGSGAWLLHTFIIRRMTEITESSLLLTADTIEDVLQHSLMDNNFDMLKDIVFDIGGYKEANSIRLFSLDGIVIASSVPDEVGIQLNQSESLCQSCHLKLNPNAQTRRIHYSRAGPPYTMVANPIENRIACQGCHTSGEAALGVMLVEFPAAANQDWRSLFGFGLIIGTLLSAIFISMAVSFFFSSRVIQPLRLINQSWKDENSIPGANEVQQLAATFARLQASAIESERELAEQHRKIDTIFSLQFEADNPPSLEKFFRQALGIVQQVTGFDSITMRLYEPGTRTFRIMAQKGMTSEMLADLQTLPAESGFHAEIVQTHQPAFTSDMSGDPRMASSAPVREGYQSLVCIPLLAQDNLVGSIQLATREKILWSPDELRWLAVIGRRIGSLIQAIQLSERIRDMAVLEERSRIAQEIHDGFAQLVGSLRLWSEEAMLSLKKNELVDVQNTLQKIEANARDAYASLRIEILGLRESIFPGKELSSIIAEYLRRYQRQYGILTQLAKDESFIEPLPISPAAEIQLLRIIQEGLTNVRRHANAHNLSVEMSNLPGSLEIKIRDDGSGFNLENIPDDRLGLKIMRERASSIGGTISIDSRQGSGTRLEIRIPMNTISKKSVERS